MRIYLENRHTTDLFKMLPVCNKLLPNRNMLEEGEENFCSSMVVNDLLPGLGFSRGVVVNSFSPEAEVKLLFKHALYLKMLCYYLNLPHCLCPSVAQFFQLKCSYSHCQCLLYFVTLMTFLNTVTAL